MVNTSKSFAKRQVKKHCSFKKKKVRTDQRTGPHIPKPTLKLSPESKTSTEIFYSHRYSSNSRARGDRSEETKEDEQQQVEGNLNW
jgi:hypothetical protein